MADEKTLGTENAGISQEHASETPSKNEGASEVLPEKAVDMKIEGSSERREGKYNEILSQVTPQSTTATPSTDDHSSDTKSIGDTIDEESKVQKLIELASVKGVPYAVKIARSLGDYYALDKMHDELVDKLYEGLLAKGLIRKE